MYTAEKHRHSNLLFVLLIRPSNLFYYESEWLVTQQTLVIYPHKKDKDQIRESGVRCTFATLSPRNYIQFGGFQSPQYFLSMF